MVEHNTAGLAPKPQDVLEADGSIRFRSDQFATSLQDASASCELQARVTREANIPYKRRASTAFDAAIHIRAQEQALTDGAAAAIDKSTSSAANIAHLLPAEGPSYSARDGEPLTQRDYKEHEDVPSAKVSKYSAHWANLLKVQPYCTSSMYLRYNLVYGTVRCRAV